MHLLARSSTNIIRMKIGWFVLALVAATLRTAQAAPDLTPTPGLSPSDVVRYQLEALQHNDDPAPDTGIAKVFRFASPANKEVTGPFGHFAQIVRSPAYAVLLNARSTAIASAKIEANRAEVTAKVVSRSGLESSFVFILSKQTEGELRDCWMTDSVLQVSAEQPADAEDLIQI